MIEAQYSIAPPLIERLRPDARQIASDETLIDRIAVGDRHAMRALYIRHNVRVFRFVLGKVKDRTVAEDLVGEIFLEVWRNAHQFGARATLSTWLLAIARYKAISALRRQKMHVELDDALGIEDPSENPEAAAETNDRNEILRSCLAKLSPSHREILDLVYYQEEPIESVAKIVGIPLNTVKTRMFYARKHLAALLQEAGVGPAAL
jgi:RNA polymerase sigma-70 factor (ECF subfamily)